MTKQTAPEVTFELNWTPADAEPDEYTRPGEAMIYRYVRAGICGPFDTTGGAADLIDAEAFGLKHNLIRTGEWAMTGNGNWSAPAAKIA